MLSVSGILFDEYCLIVRFADGRFLGFPKVWFPKLEAANEEALEAWQKSPYGIHWPDLDEDISISGLLEGRMNQYRIADATGLWFEQVKRINLEQN